MRSGAGACEGAQGADAVAALTVAEWTSQALAGDRRGARSPAAAPVSSGPHQPAGPEVGIGIIGYGMMGKAHSYGYTLAPHIRPLACRPRLRVISGRHRDGGSERRPHLRRGAGRHRLA